MTQGTHHPDALRITAGDDVAIKPPAAPAPYMKAPFAIGTAVNVETEVRITSIEDEEAARRRYLATREGVNAGVLILGQGAGEEWHTHLGYYDTVLYIRQGTAELSWKVDDETTVKRVSVGDFVYIPPAAHHQWLNVGDDDLELVWFMHFHNFDEAD
jgi:mannose-6-phosphate isomerase-like protein (cupin superfamily)